MSTRKLVLALVILAALLAVGVMFVLPSLSPRGLIVRENSRTSRNAAREDYDDAPCSTDTDKTKDRAKCAPGVIKSGQPATSAEAPFDTSTLNDGEVLVRAQVRFKSPYGLELIRSLNYANSIGDASDADAAFNLIVRFEAPEFENDFYWRSEENGLVQAVEYQTQLPIGDNGLEPGNWSARVDIGNGGSFAAINAPIIKDRILDFGTIELDFGASLGEDSWVVVGRLVHTTGLPISSFEDARLRFFTAEYDGNEYELRMLENGRFGFEIEVFNAEAKPQLLVGYDETETVKTLSPPKTSGHIVDYGDITLDCAALEVRLAGWPDRALRMARRGLSNADELEPMGLDLSLNNYANSVDHWISEPDTSALLFMHPGPYRWSAYQSEDVLAFAELSGVIDLLPGKVTSLAISFEPVQTVLVSFKAPGPLSYLQLHVSYLDDAGESEESETYSVMEPDVPYAVANPKRRPLQIFATTEGYNPISVDLPADATQCTLEFTSPTEVTAGSLYVLLPPLLPELKERGFSVSLLLTETVNGQARTRDLARLESNSVWGVEDLGRLTPWRVQAGLVSICLRERDTAMGYPDGLVCGPVEILVEADKVNVVKLPEFPAPPWPSHSHRTQMNLKCGGQPLSYVGPVSVSGKVMQLALQDNDRNYRANSEYAIVDGDARHVFQLTPPTKENSIATYSLELPARLEIRVRRGKTPFMDAASVTAHMQDGKCNCTSWAQTGESMKLWAPLGKARLNVNLQGIDSLQREVEVTSELKVIEFVLEGSFLNLVWNEQYSEEDGSPWLIRNADGEVINVANSGMHTLKMTPGSYTLIPECKSAPELRVEIKADEDVSLQVPFVPPTIFGGTALLRFPINMKPNPDGYHVVYQWYVPTGDDPMRDIQARDYYSVDDYMQTRMDGIKLLELPVNVEFVLVISIASLDEEGNVSSTGWACSPKRYTLKNTDLLTLEPDWKRGVVLDSSWEEAWNVVWTGGPGAQGFVFDNEWRVMLPGTYTLKTTDQDPVRTRNLTLTYEADKYFEMPDDVRTYLLNGESDESGSGGD